MTLFWILAAGMVFLAVLFVALPLVRRAPARDEATADRLNLSIRKDQLAELERDLAMGTLSPDQYEEGRREVEHRLLEEASAGAAPVRTTRGGLAAALGLGLLVPVLAISLYLHFGEPDAMAPIPRATGQDAAHDIGPAQLAAMVQRLADRLQDNPDDAEGWMMLGRSYAVLERYPDAVGAYARAYELLGNNPDVLTAYADALAMASGGDFPEQAVQMIDMAIQVDPTHRKGLWLAGTVAFEKGDYARAVDLWQQLATLLPEGSDVARTIQDNITEARGLMEGGEPGAPQLAQAAPASSAASAAPAASSAPAAGGPPATVSGRVTIAPAIADKVDPDAMVFIFARAPQGPPMPLAVFRTTAAKLPTEFTLDREMAMMPAMSLARFDQVMVGARISKTGNAMPQSGDLQGIVGPVAVGSTDVAVVIDQVVP